MRLPRAILILLPLAVLTSRKAATALSYNWGDGDRRLGRLMDTRRGFWRSCPGGEI